MRKERQSTKWTTVEQSCGEALERREKLLGEVGDGEHVVLAGKLTKQTNVGLPCIGTDLGCLSGPGAPQQDGVLHRLRLFRAPVPGSRKH